MTVSVGADFHRVAKAGWFAAKLWRKLPCLLKTDTMQKPPLDPDVADSAPDDKALTSYDEQHVVTYMRLLQAESEGADWREVARIVLHIDPEREPDRARNAYESSSCARKVGYRAGTSLARCRLELEEIHRPISAVRTIFFG